MTKTRRDYDEARNLLGTDKLFNLANKLFHEKEDALKKNDFRKASIIIEHGHFVCEMLTLEMYYKTDHWKSVSAYTLANTPKCTNCSRSSQCAHHNKYHGVKFREIPMQDVIALCNTCHETFHEHMKVANYWELQIPYIENQNIKSGALHAAPD